MHENMLDSRVCIRVGMDMGESIPVNVGFRQACVVSPWLFYVYI